MLTLYLFSIRPVLINEHFSDGLGIGDTSLSINDVDLVAAGIFCGVAGSIGESKQRVQVFDRCTGCGADTDTDTVILCAPRETVAGHRITDGFSDSSGTVLRTVLEENNEFIATYAGGKIITSHALPNNLTDICEQLISCSVARFVITALK